MIFPIRLTLEEHFTGEPLIYIGVFAHGLYIGMRVAELLGRMQVGTHHAWVTTEIVETLAVVGQRTAHATQTALRVDGTVLAVVERMHLDTTLGDELHHIIVGPVQDGIEGFDGLFLAASAIDAALCGFLVVLVAFGALGLAHTHDATVERLFLLDETAALSLKTVGHAMLGNELEERLVRLHYFRTLLTDMLDGAGRVDGGVVVDGTIGDACHTRQFQDHVGVLAA